MENENEEVVYNGMVLSKKWVREIREAQKLKTIKIGEEVYERIKYGEERSGWYTDQPCGDCAVKVSQYHVPGCDMEECPHCGRQAIFCACLFIDD